MSALEPPGERTGFTLFPPEAGQIDMTHWAENSKASSVSAVSQEEMDAILRVGSNTEHARMKLLVEYAKHNPDITEYVKQTFHHGYGIMTDDGPVSAWAMEDGIHFARGNGARYAQNAKILSWREATLRISALLSEGRFATNVEVEETPGFERRKIAESMLFMLQDLSDEAQEAGHLFQLREMKGVGFSDEEIERLATALENPEQRARLTEEFRQFVVAWRSNHDLLCLSFHRPVEILNRLNDLNKPRRKFQSNMTEIPPTRPFITEDEINHTFSGVDTQSKIRIRNFWREHPSAKEREKFLRGLYGVGGVSSGVSNSFDSWLFYSAKGMELKKDGCSDVQLSWSNAVSRIDALMKASRYLSAEEEEQYERNHLEATQDSAASDFDADKASGRGEAVQETSDQRETVQAASQWTTPESEAVTFAPANDTPEASGIRDIKGAPVEDTEIASGNESPTIANASSFAEPEILTGMDALEKVGIQSISPILHSIEGAIEWNAVSDFFKNCESEQKQIDFLKMHLQMYRRRDIRVNVNGQEGIRAVVYSWDERMEIHSDDARINPFRIALTWREVRRAFENEIGLESTRDGVLRDYAAVKLDKKDDILLYQVGDFFEMYGEDAELAAPLLGVNLGLKPIFDGAEQIPFCGIPAESLESYTQKLRETFDVTISGVDASTGERAVVSLPSFSHEADLARPQQAERVADASATPVKPESSVKAETQPPKPEPRTPVSENQPPREATQEDIDNALRRWNGDMDSKRAVVRYMNAHARERETAAWLSGEFNGGNAQTFHAEIPDENLVIDIPWPKVQRRIAQLIKQEKFFTEEELDNFENIDPVEIKEALAERGIVNGEVTNPAALENDAFIQQATADAERAAAREEEPEETPPPQMEKPQFAQEETAVITPKPEDVSVLSADGNAVEEFDPFSLPYHVGDTVWLENTAFAITAIRTYDVELLDPTLFYPIHRAENKERFELMLYQDPRNGPITEYLPASLKDTNRDLLNVLTENGGLLYEQDRARIAKWIRAGESNAQIAQRLPGIFAGRSDSITLLRGDPTDYLATATGLEIRVPDRSSSKLTFYWPEIAAVLRAKFQQEREGFYRDPTMKEPVNLPGTLRYQVGDSVVVPYPDRYIIGTVGYITNLEVRIDTGANSWDRELVNRIRFEEAVRHDERNAHLFQPEERTRETEASKPDGAPVRQAETGEAGTEQRPGETDGLSAPEDFCPYKAGDAVFVDNSVFQITKVRQGEVRLEERKLLEPRLMVESRERFEQLLRLDARNDYITEFLPADLKDYDDLTDALTGDGGLLWNQAKEWVSGWFLAGENNRGVAERLSLICDGIAKNTTLSNGEKVDYFAYHDFLEIHFLDKADAKRTFQWHEVAEVLRAMWQQERGGLSHKARQEEAERPEEQSVRQEAARGATAANPDRDVSGTVSDAEEAESRPNAVPSPDSAAIAPAQDVEPVRQEPEQGASSVFRPERDVAGTVAEARPDTGVLPETVVQSQSGGIAAQEETAPAVSVPENPVPATGNFRITDEHLGEGGPKAKFRANMDAIYALKAIERQGRSATKEEQETLSRYVGWGGIPEAFDPEKTEWRLAYQELEAALTADEYADARASTLNAHYTSPVVIKAVYQAIENMGFKKGNILEPSCGVGNFFGLLPESMSASNLYGVELDGITGRIAQQLYPKAKIAVQGYEKTDYPKDFFDLAIGNVPFGNYQVNDPAYNKLGFSIHNYFFAKALDQVRPGGVIAFLTSRYTLDAQNSDVRQYLAKRAKLLGAIRLPNDAFKANAGTQVVSDIIFLQKSDAPIVEQPEWTKVGVNQDNFLVNRYFLNHPEMVLGVPTSESTQYGRQDYTVAPIPGANLAELLSQAIENIHGEIKEAELPDLGEDEPVQDYIPADPSVRNFSYTVVNGDVYYRENSIMVRPDLSATAAERVKGMVELRDCVNALIAMQMKGNDALSIYVQQKKLNQLYDAFTARYGLVNDRANASAFSADSAYYLLCSLEVLDKDGRLERKADMFTKRTIKPHTAVTYIFQIVFYKIKNIFLEV